MFGCGRTEHTNCSPKSLGVTMALKNTLTWCQSKHSIKYMDSQWKILSIEFISQDAWALCRQFFHKQAAEQLCPVWFLDWQANTKCVKAAGGRQEEGLRGWEGEGAEQQRHRLASPAPSTAWLYATANSLCPSSAQLHLRALRHLEGRREREEIEGWAGSSEFHCAILGCDVICRYPAYKQSSIFWG